MLNCTACSLILLKEKNGLITFNFNTVKICNSTNAPERETALLEPTFSKL